MILRDPSWLDRVLREKHSWVVTIVIAVCLTIVALAFSLMATCMYVVWRLTP